MSYHVRTYPKSARHLSALYTLSWDLQATDVRSSEFFNYMRQLHTEANI